MRARTGRALVGASEWRAEDRKRLLDEGGRFIAGLVGRHALWFCLTYRRDVSQTRAETDLQCWLRFAARDLAHNHIRAPWALGFQDRGVLHFHVLLDWPYEATTSEIAALSVHWKTLNSRTGKVWAERYNPELGAAHYQVGHEKFDVFVACPRLPRCRRRNGCLESKHGWRR